MVKYTQFRFLTLPFLIGLISAQKINLTGELYLGEIIAVAYIIANISKLRLSKTERTVVAFALIWAGAQLVSDLYNKTEIIDAIKGILAPIVFASTFVSLINYFKDKFERFPSFALGVTIGGLIYLLLFPSEYFLYNAWKWGFGGAVLGIFIIYFSFFLKEKSNALLFFVLILFLVVTLYFDARGMAVFPILSALAYKIYYGKKKSFVRKRLSGNWAGIKIIFIALPALFLINVGASALFSSAAVLSHLSDTAAAKYKTQATGTYGILLGGRSEILVSGQAFLDKPLLGHGSWAKDKGGYLDRYSILRNQLGYSLREDNQYEDFGSDLLIPAHSYLMGALVWGGILGGFFWLIVLNSTLNIFIKNLNFFPIYFYAGMIGFMWDVFFSPFGATARWSTAVFLAAFFSFEHYLKFNRRVSI